MSANVQEIISEEQETTRKLKVLVLDDDPAILKFLAAILEKKFEVISLEVASEIFQVTDKENPDLILLDLTMPNIDGFEILNLAKNHAVTASVPIICMSSDNSRETRERVRNAGAFGFIKKPFKPESLLGDLEALIETLNETFESKNKMHTFTINHNDQDKYQMIHQIIKNETEEGRKVIFLSWDRGEDFLTEKELELVESNQLIFLQIKPSLIVKFPYIQDVSPVFQEIFDYTKDEDSYHLVFDELRNILNVYDQDRALAKTYALSGFINSSFKRSSIFNTRPSKYRNALLLEKMARIFTGKGR